jgi:hypothetical protein
LFYVVYPDGSKDVFITVPIKATFVDNIPGAVPITANVSGLGSIAAYAHVPAPEPSSVVLGLFGAAGLAVALWKRRALR